MIHHTLQFGKLIFLRKFGRERFRKFTRKKNHPKKFMRRIGKSINAKKKCNFATPVALTLTITPSLSRQASRRRPSISICQQGLGYKQLAAESANSTGSTDQSSTSCQYNITKSQACDKDAKKEMLLGRREYRLHKEG